MKADVWRQKVIISKQPIKGEKGDSGDRGPNGDVGKRGRPGVAGEPGPQGPVGPRGPAGGAISIAIQISGCGNWHGWNEGPAGVDGISGVPGDPGAAGVPGLTGRRGYSGPSGRSGWQWNVMYIACMACYRVICWLIGAKGNKGNYGPKVRLNIFSCHVPSWYLCIAFQGEPGLSGKIVWVDSTSFITLLPQWFWMTRMWHAKTVFLPLNRQVYLGRKLTNWKCVLIHFKVCWCQFLKMNYDYGIIGIYREARWLQDNSDTSWTYHRITYNV